MPKGRELSPSEPPLKRLGRGGAMPKGRELSPSEPLLKRLGRGGAMPKGAQPKRAPVEAFGSGWGEAQGSSAQACLP
jgi:hypothetical protein